MGAGCEIGAGGFGIRLALLFHASARAQARPDRLLLLVVSIICNYYRLIFFFLFGLTGVLGFFFKFEMVLGLIVFVGSWGLFACIWKLELVWLFWEDLRFFNGGGEKSCVFMP